LTLALAETIRPVVENICLPLSVIQAIAGEIVQCWQPDKVILFGSYAYGTPEPWGDVDLLIAGEFDKDPISAVLEIRWALPRYHFSLDLVIRSQADINNRIEINDLFMKEIVPQGRIRYDRHANAGRVDHQG
jgi:uncharacterized protein